jgi:hypothetical protein
MARDDFDDDGYVSITKDEYESLKEDSEFLANLRAAGVDNWDGYYYGYGEREDW